MAELSQNTQKLIQQYQAWYSSLQPKEGTPTIHVDEVASKVAAFYEKIRGVVEWREEHLMKRAAIERILKRRLLFKNGEAEAEPFVLELIRGGHFPNDRIPESKIEEIQKIFDKYGFVLQNSPRPKEKQKIQLFDWILGIAACEIEETLVPSIRERSLIEYMEAEMKDRIKTRENIKISEEEKNTQIFIAVQRALLKLDSPIITYNLLKRKYPQWRYSDKDNPQLQSFAQNVYSTWKEIDKELRHPLSDKFYKICERYNTPYLILGDAISEDPTKSKERLSQPEVLEKSVKENYQKRLKTIKSRLGRAAIYATISIFVTKMLLAFAVEVPLDRYFIGQFDYLTIGINILTPPLLMFFLVLTISTPKEENLQRVIMEVSKIAYTREKKEVYIVEPKRERGWVMESIITLFYLITFFVSFGLIIWGLNELNFSILSVIIFLVFVSLISFAGVKIRERSKELEVVERKESFLVTIIDLFSLPIIQVGKWLSSQWTRYNVIVVLFNFLIDMPFQRFVEFVEQWRGFLKEKKEEIH